MIIGITGRKGAGKDTVASILVDVFGIKRIALADTIKEMCMDWFNLSYEDVYDPIQKETPNQNLQGKTPRQLLQECGTNWFRKYDSNFWIKRLLAKANDYEVVVVPDIRFPNEAKICDAVIRVVRPTLEPVGLLGYIKDMREHESENYWKTIPADYTIRNIDYSDVGIAKEVMRNDVISAYCEIIGAKKYV